LSSGYCAWVSGSEIKKKTKNNKFKDKNLLLKVVIPTGNLI